MVSPGVIESLRQVDWSGRLKTLINPTKFPLSKLILLAGIGLFVTMGVWGFSHPKRNSGFFEWYFNWLGEFFLAGCCIWLLFHVEKWSAFWSEIRWDNPKPVDVRWSNTRAILSCIGTACLGVVICVFGPVGIYAIYSWVAGSERADRTAAVILLACTGAAGGFYVEFAKQYGLDSPAASDSRLRSYIKAGLDAGFGTFVVIAAICAIGAFVSPAYTEEAIFASLQQIGPTLVFAFAAAVIFAFFAVCNLARKRHEFLWLAAIGVVVPGAAIGGVGLFAIVDWWLVMHDKPELTISWLNGVFILGAVLGAAFELWRRFAKPRGWSTMVTIGAAIRFLADATGRGKLVAIGMFWTALGAFVLTSAVWFAFLDVGPIWASIRWTIVFVGSVVGLYLAFHRGLGPAWKAITGPEKLTEDDRVHGQADYAEKDEAARAARGGRR